MKRSRFIVAVAFAGLLLLGSAVAQSGAIWATVPFDFVVGQKTLPAGDYKIALQGAALQLYRLDGNGAAFVMYTPSARNKNTSPRLIFNRYGDRHFLAQAWISDMGHDLSKSSQEIQYALEQKKNIEVLASARPRN